MKENLNKEIFLFSRFFILKSQISLKMSYTPVHTIFRKNKVNLVLFQHFSHFSSTSLVSVTSWPLEAFEWASPPPTPTGLPPFDLSLSMMLNHPLMESYSKENNIYGIYKQRFQIARICQRVSSTIWGKHGGLKDIVTVEIDLQSFSR